MKKLFFIAAVAGAALAGCTKNELAPSAKEQQEISFTAPVVGTQTKAPVYGAIGATYNTEETFDVWCVYNASTITEWGGTAYFNNVTASHNATKGGWILTPTYYWPAEGYLSFVALSPSITNTTTYSATNGFQITDWSQGTTEEAIIDLMYSNESLNNAKVNFNANGEEKTGDANSYKGVDITFNHALSYLVFKIKTAANYSGTTTFRLKSITLSDIYTTGDFTQIPAVTDPVTPNWAVDTSDPAKVGTYVAYDYSRVSGATPLVFNYDATDVPETGTKEIILLPQALTTNQQKIEIKYQISTDSGANWIDQTQEVDLTGSIAAWEMGKKYTYTISISMDEIILDPAVTTWTDATEGSIGL